MYIDGFLDLLGVYIPFPLLPPPLLLTPPPLALSQMNTEVEDEINDYLLRKKVETTEDIFVSIDSQLAVLAGHLDSVIFERQFLPGLWKAVVASVKYLVTKQFREKKKLTKGMSERLNHLMTVGGCSSSLSRCVSLSYPSFFSVCRSWWITSTRVARDCRWPRWTKIAIA